jgi:ribosomal protein S18 acetylase RimI-like enzyme
MSEFTLRPLDASDQSWLPAFMVEHWGADLMITRGRAYVPSSLPGYVATQGGHVSGLLTYRIDGMQCEVMSLDSLREGVGIGSALIDAATNAARRAGCSRLWLITTNDNSHALRFYQRRGFVLAAFYRDSIAASRTLKPQISAIGLDGIPIRDELELELSL